jgi:DNA-binding NtrC family response regulator
VPVALGGHLICALSTSTFRHYCAWEDRLIDRFRLVGQILAHAIVRSRAPVRMTETRLRRLNAVERDYIRLVIDRCGGRINGRGHAAEVLGLHPNTLRSRMKKLGIRRRGRQ